MQAAFNIFGGGLIIVLSIILLWKLCNNNKAK